MIIHVHTGTDPGGGASDSTLARNNAINRLKHCTKFIIFKKILIITIASLSNWIFYFFFAAEKKKPYKG